MNANEAIEKIDNILLDMDLSDCDKIEAIEDIVIVLLVKSLAACRQKLDVREVILNGDLTMNDGNAQLGVVVTDALKGKVLDLIISLTEKNEVFTAFDLTEQIRVENPTMNIPHNDVRDMVFEEYRNTFCDDYQRTLTLIEKNGRRSDSYVYHLDTVSALTHSLAVQPAVVPTPTSSVSTDTDLTVEKRLNIPKSILAKLGLVAGKMVRIRTDDGIMSLTEVTASRYETLYVNTDGRLRLNALTLTNAFGRLPDNFDISFNKVDWSIEVKPK